MKKINKLKTISLISLLLFLLCLILYLTNSFKIIDENIYNFIISFKSDFMTTLMTIITNLASPQLVCIIIFILLILSIFKGKIPLIITFILGGQSIINYIIKNIIRRDRPNILRLVIEDSYSFPSGHTMVAVVLYGFLIYIIYKTKINKKLKLIASIFIGLIPILIMISRIYLGVHYFSDVISGMFLSIAYLFIIIDIIERKKLI